MLRFKVLDPGGVCRNGGKGSWHLPKGKRPGKWMPKVKPVPCESGYHVCTALQLLTGDWLGPEVWVVEVRGKSQKCSDKSCHEQGRIIESTYWCEKVARLFAADCAEHSLIEFEKHYPDDKRPREAIAVARRYAVGQATLEELDAAESAARKSAAESAARSAAWSAAWSAARSAAESAARSAAWSAAESAARSAAESAARKSAAESAARSAAWSAAWSAARSAAESAAASAARSAERKWQARRLRSYLTGALGRKATGG